MSPYYKYIEKDQRFRAAVDRAILPTETALPAYSRKVGKLDSVTNYIKEHQNELPILYRYSDADECNLENLRKHVVYLSAANTMNDWLEGDVFGADRSLIEGQQQEIFLKCFSIHPCRTIMWSQYAKNHCGICVGYDFSRADETILKHLFPVQYARKRFTAQHPASLVKNPYFYIRKGKQWEREAEWRLIYTKEELPQTGQEIGLDFIKEVRFGLRTSEGVKERVKDIVHGTNIELYQTTVIDGEFGLRKERVL